MGVPFSNHHAGQGGWCIRRAELRWLRGRKQERNLAVLPAFALTPISPEAGCSASHEQSFFQHQNIPQPGFGSFLRSSRTKVAQSHFTGSGAERGDEEMPNSYCRDAPPATGNVAAVGNGKPSTGASTALASEPRAPGALRDSRWDGPAPPPSSAPGLRWGPIPS